MLSRFILILGLLFACTSWAGESETLTSWSDSIEIDKTYKSMFGPTHGQSQSVGGDSNGLVWLTGFKATIADENRDKTVSQEFMCHTNVTIPNMQKRFHGLEGHLTTVSNPYQPLGSPNGRIFVISQGQAGIHFPQGFGIPVNAGTQISFYNQALNLSDHRAPFNVHYKNQLSFEKDESCTKEIKPLYLNMIEIMASLSSTSSYINVHNPPDIPEEAMCAPGEQASYMGQNDQLGNPFHFALDLEAGKRNSPHAGHFRQEHSRGYPSAFHHVSYAPVRRISFSGRPHR
jgi:hypothetical protein